VVERDGDPILEVRLEPGRTVLGSHPTSDIVLPGESLSAAALVVLDTGDRFRVRRLDPSLSLPVGPDGEAELETGSRIEIGHHSLRFERRSSRARRPDRTRILSGEGGSARTPALRVERRGRAIDIAPDRSFAIGTDPANDLVLEDPFVSAFHCRLVSVEGRWSVLDLDSTNGTLLGGLRVREAELPDTGKLVVGETLLVVRIRPREDDEPPDRPFGMLGPSAVMQRLFEDVVRVAKSSEPVLVTGASGTGKELVARALHDASGRSGPFLALNCGALNAPLVESELFGHVRGAFTGAASDRKGAFEAARGGTLFLDEIGELPLGLQPKLLRALETSSVRRVGATTETPVDVRIVAATHRHLEALVRRREFREDLFHRLFVLGIRIPPLSERPDDIIPLAEHFLAQQPGARRLSSEAEEKLRGHTWPGNVRELRNVIIRAIYAAPTETIEAEHLVFSARAFGDPAGTDARRHADRDEEALRADMVDALTRTGGNRSEAARILGVSKSTFFDRLRRFGIG